MDKCSTCKASWSEGDFTSDCPECGGFAMTRACRIAAENVALFDVVKLRCQMLTRKHFIPAAVNCTCMINSLIGKCNEDAA